MPAYRPRRASKRWLEGAPDYILSVHDNGGKTCDRYTVCFGGKLWDQNMDRNVSYLAIGDHPSYYFQSGEMPSHNRVDPKIRWLDLPSACRESVISWAEKD